MFFPEGQLRVHLYGQPCDMRRSFDGLSAMVRHELRADPCDGSLYCFVNRRATQSKDSGNPVLAPIFMSV
jgi:transposase